MMTTKAAALALALAAAILCVAQAQLPDVGSLAQTAILGEVNKAVGSGFLCNSGASSGLIDALPGSGESSFSLRLSLSLRACARACVRGSLTLPATLFPRSTDRRTRSTGPVSLLNSIFGLGVEQGYRWATSSGPLTGVNGLTGC